MVILGNCWVLAQECILGTLHILFAEFVFLVHILCCNGPRLGVPCVPEVGQSAVRFRYNLCLRISKGGVSRCTFKDEVSAIDLLFERGKRLKENFLWSTILLRLFMVVLKSGLGLGILFMRIGTWSKRFDFFASNRLYLPVGSL